jgi:3-deoxy-7-phosphoheptulonate synthase
MKKTYDIRVQELVPLIPSRDLKRELPMSEPANRTVVQGRRAVREILAGRDRRMLMVVGPCSIHDERAALDYAGRLVALSRALADRLLIVMRVYFEKPRTTIGWKGLINDPHLDGSFDMEAGLRKARGLLRTLNEMGMPAATEMLDPITPQYTADLIAWASIGARTTESQTHRQMSSGLSMPIGYKNGTDGNLEAALNAMQAARQAHSFLGINPAGRTCIVKTTGNPDGHLILRGGRSGPNYSVEHVADALDRLREAGLPAVLMVDCNHDNSGKQFGNQAIVWRDVMAQRAAGNAAIVGIMLESNLEQGRQTLGDPQQLKYGVSITDACVGWAKTEELLREAHAALGTEVRAGAGIA